MYKIFLAPLLLFLCFYAQSQRLLLDPFFGNKGWVSTHFSAGNQLSEAAVALFKEPDGGHTVMITATRTVLIRINPDGNQDLNYGTAGYSYPVNVLDPKGARQADGKILVAGNNFGTTPPGFTMARFNTDGSLDSSFNGTGIRNANLPEADGHVRALLVQPDGKIIVAGTLFQGEEEIFAGSVVVRLHSNGDLDTGFNHTGWVLTDSILANAATIQPDGKIILAGTTNRRGNNPDFAFLRLNEDGTPDAQFGTGGITSIGLGGADGVAAVLIDLNNKILADRKSVV